MWCLLFSRKKLSVRDKKQLQDILADIAYTCGATLEELDLPDNLKSAVVHVHNCHDPVEKLYYSADFQPICIYCSSEEIETPDQEGYYPQCQECSDKPQISKRTVNKSA